MNVSVVSTATKGADPVHVTIRSLAAPLRFVLRGGVCMSACSLAVWL